MSDHIDAEKAYYDHRIGNPSHQWDDECDECDRLWQAVVDTWPYSYKHWSGQVIRVPGPSE